MTETFSLSAMGGEDIAAAHRLSQDIGWPHRAEDWRNILRISKGIVAYQGGRLVGTAVCSLYPDRGRLNMVIVHPDMRGRGLGRRVVQAALDQARDLPMSLIATEDGFALYEKLGFVPYGEIIQYQGPVATLPPLTGQVGQGCLDDLETVATLDRAAGNPDRRALLAEMIQRGKVLLMPDGFAITTDFGRGTTLGPLIAKDLTSARALLSHTVQDLQGRFLRMDTDPADGFGADIAAMGLAKVGGGGVMHRTPPPQVNGYTTYALASQALG